MTARPQILFCIGAQKAGTTWLHRYFSDHPDVHAPDCKELHYFSSVFRPNNKHELERRRQQLDAIPQALPARAVYQARHLVSRWVPSRAVRRAGVGDLRALVDMHETHDPSHARYLRVLTKGQRAERWVVDNSPGYDLLEANHFARMIEEFPEAKFLYVLRDPVDRAMSGIRMQYRYIVAEQGQGDYGDYLRAILNQPEKHRHFLTRSRYPRAIRALESAVPKERIQYLFYETLFADLAVARLCEFLEIPFKSGRYDQVVFQGHRPDADETRLRSYLQEKLSGVYRQLDDTFGPTLPEAWQPGVAAARGMGHRAGELSAATDDV